MKYAVITGASSGIGEAFAYKFAQEGCSLVLVARRYERLQELKNHLLQIYPALDIQILSIDLSKEQGCEELLQFLSTRKVQYFINNAGFGDCSPFLDGKLEKELDMIDLNIKTLHILMKGILAKMKEQKEGYLLNVGSSAGLFPGGPYMATYYATKAYVVSITRAVAQELQGQNLYVGVLCPGPVNTEFNQVANVQFALAGITGKECVDYAYKKMHQKKVTIIPTLRMKLAVFGGRFLSSSLLVKLVARQQKKKIYEKK